MALSNTLSLLASVTLFLMLANKVNSQDATSFTFDIFTEDDPDLIYQGDAHALENGILRLIKTDAAGTTPQANSVGRVLYSAPVHLWDSSRLATFETTFRFIITHTNSNPADGIAFFLAPPDTIIPTGSQGGNLGIFPTSGSQNQVVGVEFDVYVNGQWDPSYRHIGIDIESRQSKNATKWESVSGQVVTARINYDANLQRLTVTVNAFPQGRRVNQETYTVTYDNVNLKTLLPEYVRVGISGATGAEVAIHDIRSWYFSSYLVYTAKKEKEDMYIAQYV